MKIQIHRKKIENDDGEIVDVIGPPHPKQLEILNLIFAEPSKSVKQVDLVCGRGFGKSTVAIDIAQAMLGMPGQVGYFTEPDKPTMSETFLAEWERIVPDEVYTHNISNRKIIWKSTGSVLYYGHRAVTGSRARTRNKFRGRNLTFVIDDEAADSFDMEMYTNTRACIRLPSKVRVHFTCSTPRVGEYEHMISQPSHIQVTGTSYDNPFVDRELIEQWKSEMGSQQFEREVLGRFVSLEGRVFKHALVNLQNYDEAWPKGNVNWDHPTFKPGQPWWLFGDLGSATGSYVVAQRTPAPVNWGGYVWVLVADLCPETDASASRAFQRLNSEFGRPCCVVAGKDIKTESAADGVTVANIATQVWGNVPIMPTGEIRANKQIQYDWMSSLIKTVTGRRRLTVAKDFVSLDDNSRRGVIDCLLKYEFREAKDRRQNEFLPKGNDQPLCHVADAMLMGTVQVMAPPAWIKRSELAA